MKEEETEDEEEEEEKVGNFDRKSFRSDRNRSISCRVNVGSLGPWSTKPTRQEESSQERP